ncbi:helix-turn-helix domain-containing protein, partial [Riemerella anatipestifer]|nr:helix-turn-helix domain-containing protein [Riemerella anatipestifer]MCQ4182060.1 helix-turn-helix domain-containing protein [Riemerella anatipestifer]MCW0475291.1 helix-turn-helix domain-containing protein [Riemerella anatipestifer]
MGATERVVQFIEYKGISKYKFCKDLGFSNKFLDNSSNMGTDKACKILHYFPEINPEWLLTGKGEMIKSKQGGEVEKSKNLIPFYDDVATVGGTDLVADTYNAVSVATDYIDAGDWFPSATAAIRHYGTSMVEYPNG